MKNLKDYIIENKDWTKRIQSSENEIKKIEEKFKSYNIKIENISLIEYENGIIRTRADIYNKSNSYLVEFIYDPKNKLFGFIKFSSDYTLLNFVNNKWEETNIGKDNNGIPYEKNIIPTTKIDDLSIAFEKKNVQDLIKILKEKDKYDAPILTYNDLIKNAKSYQTHNKSFSLKPIEKLLEPYKDKSFVEVANSGEISDLYDKIIYDGYDPENDENTLNYLEVGEESWITINKYKNKLYLNWALDLDSSYLYLIK